MSGPPEFQEILRRLASLTVQAGSIARGIRLPRQPDHHNQQLGTFSSAEMGSITSTATAVIHWAQRAVPTARWRQE